MTIYINRVRDQLTVLAALELLGSTDHAHSDNAARLWRQWSKTEVKPRQPVNEPA